MYEVASLIQEANTSSARPKGLLSRWLGNPSGSSNRRPLAPRKPNDNGQPQYRRNGGSSSTACAALASATLVRPAVQQQQQQGFAGDGDVPPRQAPLPPKTPNDLGYARDLERSYEVGREIGRGGNGFVRLVTSRDNGQQYACKSILKAPENVSEKKQAGHLLSIKREVEVLTRLRGSLNIVNFIDVFEDDQHVHIVMEHCKGGELHHTIGAHHYSERTVASYMRAVLRTLAQCHSHHILHRDIKPGNFMLLTADERSPLKAIDFGLATPYDPQQLPCTDLGLEGTPWFMAPEVLSGRVTPASDVWSAGVMAYQLLSGYFPFDDPRNPRNPSLSAVWKSILTDDLAFRKSVWADISEPAKDFLRSLLHRDPEKRPTAKEALQHSWLAGNSAERSTGRRLQGGVVQRIQRFAQSSVFKRTVLQSMAAELLQHQLGDSNHGACSVGPDGHLALVVPQGKCVQQVLDKLHLGPGPLHQEELAAGLKRLGFKLAPGEAERLLQGVDLDADGRVDRVALAASLLDWRLLQERHLDTWLESARAAFEQLDTDCDGVIGTDEIVACLRQKVPESELSMAVRQALQEAAVSGADEADPQEAAGIDFPGFLRMLRPGSVDSLDQYDDRRSLASSVDRLDLLDRSAHGHDSSHHSVDTNPSVGSALSPPAFAPPPPDAPAPVFRFDVGRSAAPRSAPPAQQPAAAGGCRGTAALQVRPGFQERRMHGSNLYRNALLATVNE